MDRGAEEKTLRRYRERLYLILVLAVVLSSLVGYAIARSAMTLKEDIAEPTCPLVIAQCPNAAVNPETGAFVCKQVIYSIFEAECYGEDPAKTSRTTVSRQMRIMHFQVQVE